MKEKTVFHVNGYLGLIIALALLAAGGWFLYLQSILLGTLFILLGLLTGSSLTVVQPNTAKVLTFLEITLVRSGTPAYS